MTHQLALWGEEGCVDRGSREHVGLELGEKHLAGLGIRVLA